MNRLKQFINNHKVTFMIIPNSRRDIKQKNGNLAIMFLILLLLILVNLIFLLHTYFVKQDYLSIQRSNRQLETQLLIKDDTIYNLEQTITSKEDEVKNLSASLDTSTQYLEEKLADMNEVQTYMNNILSMFNENTAANVDIPVSRSFVRSTETGQTEIDFASTTDGKLKALQSQTQDDELTVILDTEALDYAKLAEEVQGQLDYLECRPDAWPTYGALTSGFGYRIDPVYGTGAYHKGQDIANSVGTPITAAGSGVVSYAGYSGEFGYVIIVNHGYGYQSIYAHCSELLVDVNDPIKKGDLIAKMGNSGKSTGSHLHFEVRYNGSAINPLNILK